MRSLILATVATLTFAGPAFAGLDVELVGKKYQPDPAKVLVKQTDCNMGGSTSIRNVSVDGLEWKVKGYYERNRDLGQVFTAPKDFTLDAIVLRTGPSYRAVMMGAPGSELFIQFYEVTGMPKLNDNGTPMGTDAKHGFSKNHRCDDFMEGITFKPMKVVRGGTFPKVPPTCDAAGKPTGDESKLTYLRFAFTGDDRMNFVNGKRYAFMVGFVEPGPERGFTLGNRNSASQNAPPSITDKYDLYHGGWGLRREGDGTTPPTMLPPDSSAPTGEKRDAMIHQSFFGSGDARYELSPTTDGYPDVDTYRDLEFYLEASAK